VVYTVTKKNGCDAFLQRNPLRRKTLKETAENQRRILEIGNEKVAAHLRPGEVSPLNKSRRGRSVILSRQLSSSRQKGGKERAKEGEELDKSPPPH